MFMEIWLMLYSYFTLFGFIPIGILGIKLIINLYFWPEPDRFEISILQYQCICIYLAIQIYGLWAFEIYEAIKEKEKAQRKKEVDELVAEIDERMAKAKETRKMEKNTKSERDPGTLV